MANRSRTARRAAERNRLRSTKQIPQDVRDRLEELTRGGGAAAPPPPPPTSFADTSAAGGAERGADAPADADLPPGIPSDLPPELAGAIKDAQRAVAGERSPSASRRQKRFIDLEKELAVLLVLPGPVFEGGGDTYCAMHFMVQGPMLASTLTSYAETNPATAQLLERIVAAGGFAVVAMAIFSYALPPMLHHGLPAPEGLRKMYHVPPKEAKPPPDVEGEAEEGGK
jgi:hypothetical protein